MTKVANPTSAFQSVTTTVEVEVTGVSAPVASRLEELVVESDGVLDAATIVADAASHPGGPLHSFFEWDDSKAAAEYRLEQAGTLIRRVKIRRVETTEDGPRRVTVVRKYVAEQDAADTYTPGRYLPMESVLANPALEENLKDSIRRDMERIKKKYSDLLLVLSIAEEVFGEE